MVTNTLPPLPEDSREARYAHIPGFPGYAASTDGRILSCFKNKWGYSDTWRALRPGSNNKYGRQIVVLILPGRVHKSNHVHRLILSAFVGPCPAGCEACHNNGNAGDNRLANLRWDTRAANIRDLVKHGHMPRGENHHGHKLTDAIVREIRRRRGTATHQRIAEDLGIMREDVSKILRGEAWSHVV